MTATAKSQALLLNFKSDTLTGVSRNTLRALAKKLGFSETQTIHFALARLNEDAQQADLEEDYMPLTKDDLAAIRKHEPKRRGRVISSLLR